MTKGTIVLIPFPFTDLTGQKVRPAIVLRDFTKSEDCIVAFVSSVKSSVKPKKLEPFDIYVQSSPENGLKINSVIKIGKLATLQKKIILGELGMLEAHYLKKVTEKLGVLFGV
ncbi:MAG: type II toxin-antitoxin system PemK/MazF family toxin [Patescibacteria group bacterium]